MPALVGYNSVAASVFLLRKSSIMKSLPICIFPLLTRIGFCSRSITQRPPKFCVQVKGQKLSPKIVAVKQINWNRLKCGIVIVNCSLISPFVLVLFRCHNDDTHAHSGRHPGKELGWEQPRHHHLSGQRFCRIRGHGRGDCVVCAERVLAKA